MSAENTLEKEFVPYEWEKEFVPHQESLELKNLGFNEPCLAWRNKSGILLMDITIGSYSPLDDPYKQEDFELEKECTCPTFSQAFRWFREKGFHSAIMPKITPSNTTVYYIYEGKPKKDWNNCFKSYEEAELVCLRKLIETVKNEKAN